MQAHRRRDGRSAGQVERGLSAAAGTVLLVRGVARRDLAGWLALAAGSVLIARGAAGRTARSRGERPSTALREALLACRKGGTVSLAGVYGGYLDKVPLGAAFNKALRLRMGQTHVHRYLRPLLERVQRGELDAREVITHHLPLEEAPYGYEIFRDKEDECIKVVLQP